MPAAPEARFRALMARPCTRRRSGTRHEIREMACSSPFRMPVPEAQSGTSAFQGLPVGRIELRLVPPGLFRLQAGYWWAGGV